MGCEHGARAVRAQPPPLRRVGKRIRPPALRARHEREHVCPGAWKRAAAAREPGRSSRWPPRARGPAAWRVSGRVGKLAGWIDQLTRPSTGRGRRRRHLGVRFSSSDRPRNLARQVGRRRPAGDGAGLVGLITTISFTREGWAAGGGLTGRAAPYGVVIKSRAHVWPILFRLCPAGSGSIRPHPCAIDRGGNAQSNNNSSSFFLLLSRSRHQASIYPPRRRRRSRFGSRSLLPGGRSLHTFDPSNRVSTAH